MNYRLDIQALRGTAILAVVIFHLNPIWLPGGFVGVDIFFVISGYLITQLLLKEKSSAQPILWFYRRRITRLFPAYFFMLSLSTFFVYLFLFPKESIDFSYSLISAVFYVSNIYFSANLNYLTVDTHLLPLLHTWSLSAEAQCYLVFPFIFYSAVKQKIVGTGTFLFVLLIVMFATNIFLTQHNPDIAFFSPTVRFYQFLSGAIIVFLPIDLTSNRKQMIGCFVIGLMLISISFFIINRFSEYPGILSLLPTIGSMLIIASGVQHQLLTNKLLVYIGTISYSLYLWHWPIIVFYKILISPYLTSIDYLWIISISLIMSILSWHFIENRFKQITANNSAIKVIILSALFSLALIFINSIFIFSDGLRHRYSEQELYFAETDFSQNSKEMRITDSCIIYKNRIESFTPEKCIHTNPDKINVLLLGDSHAEHFRRALEDYSDKVSVSVATISACRPTLPGLGRKTCTKMLDRVYTQLIKEYPFDMVIVSARWSDKTIESMPNAINALKDNIERVIVLGPIITYASSLPNLLARYSSNLDKAVSLKKIRLYDQAAVIDTKFEDIVKDNGAEYISLLKLICPNSQCQVVTKTGKPIQWDYGHLTYDGATEIVEKMNLF